MPKIDWDRIDTDRIDDAVLALMLLGLHDYDKVFKKAEALFQAMFLKPK